MNTADPAQEVVSIYIEVLKEGFKITGVASKHIAVMLYTMMKDKKQTKGKTRLTNMLKTGKSLKIFTIKAEDLKKFSQEAKKYGVLYCALADKKNSKIDGLVDILVREEDASKVNRIAERFNFADVATIEKELELQKEKERKEPKQEKTKEKMIVDALFEKPKQVENEIPTPSNKNDTVEKSLSEISSNIKQSDNKNLENGQKKSVKKELQEIEKELKEKQNNQSEITETEKQTDKKEPKHLNENKTGIIVNTKQAKRFKEEKEEKKPKHLKEPKHLETQNRKKRRNRKRERSK